MAPTSTVVGSLLRQIIHQHLDNASYDSAVFFAERLVAADPKATDSVYLFALCHFRSGDHRSAYDVGKPLGCRGNNLGCAWIFAQACLALERFKEGIVAIEKSRALWSSRQIMGKHTANARTWLPDASAVLCLLGKLYRGHGDKKKAVSSFEDSLKMNPFMWDAFTALCDMGITLRVPNIFRPNDSLAQSFETGITWTSGLEQAREMPPLASLDITHSKRYWPRPTQQDLGTDPFSSGFPPIETSSPGRRLFTETSESDFMSKIQNARQRLALSENNQISSEGLETPPGSLSQADTAANRQMFVQEPPHAPARQPRNVHGADAGLPPRMNYPMGAKRNARPGQDSSAVEPMLDAPGATTSSTTANRAGLTAVTEKKRTISGHPIPRSTHPDEHSTRRSARLNLFRPSSKANSGAATIGTSAGRELRKARPPVSRIMRSGSSGSSVGRVVSGNRKPLDDQADMDHGESSRVREPPPQPVAPRDPDVIKIEEALRWSLDLMKKIGTGYYLQSRYQCQEALQAYGSLPTAQQGTPWVLSQMGRCYYEQAAYAEAENFFRKMRTLAPSRLRDMEVYSTVLWQLKREPELSFLAHELVDSAWHSPQAWCALGNALSLSRDPERALRCFKRATQVDPQFAYAFTLQGHEHMANEEYDKALTVFRQAIAADRRHYNAYYGIGRVQERLGDHDQAYDHYRAAHTINPNNAIIMSCMASVLEKRKQIGPALQAYSKAVEMAPKAVQTRYKKARVLAMDGQLEAAMEELLVLKDVAADQATVHFLLGKLYKQAKERQLAVRHFTMALSLDPKAAPKIKEAIEEIDVDVESEEFITP